MIGVGAAVENIVPLVPADTFVLLGAFLAASGDASLPVVFLVTWLANVASAVGVYFLAWHFGEGFFATRIGHLLLQPRQLQQVGRFYARWGAAAILLSRFLPALRAIVPVFAGVTRLPLRRVLLPLAAASAAWYGLLVYLGGVAGRNWDAIHALFGRMSTVLLLLALAAAAVLASWWWRTRDRR